MAKLVSQNAHFQHASMMIFLKKTIARVQQASRSLSRDVEGRREGEGSAQDTREPDPPLCRALAFASSPRMFIKGSNHGAVQRRVWLGFEVNGPFFSQAQPWGRGGQGL